MRSSIKYLAGILITLAFSAATLASPVNITSIDFVVQQAIKSNDLDINANEMTFADFVSVANYQTMVISIEKIPIANINSFGTVLVTGFRNIAAKQNLNFERPSS